MSTFQFGISIIWCFAAIGVLLFSRNRMRSLTILGIILAVMMATGFFPPRYHNSLPQDAQTEWTPLTPEDRAQAKEVDDTCDENLPEGATLIKCGPDISGHRTRLVEQRAKPQQRRTKYVEAETTQRPDYIENDGDIPQRKVPTPAELNYNRHLEEGREYIRNHPYAESLPPVRTEPNAGLPMECREILYGGKQARTDIVKDCRRLAQRLGFLR